MKIEYLVCHLVLVDKHSVICVIQVFDEKLLALEFVLNNQDYFIQTIESNI
jgi:hypothetical protein